MGEEPANTTHRVFAVDSLTGKIIADERSPAGNPLHTDASASGASLRSTHSGLGVTAPQGRACGQIGQTASTQPAYIIGDTESAAKHDFSSCEPQTLAQIPQLIGQSGPTSSGVPGSILSVGTANNSTICGTVQAPFPIADVSVAAPAHLALPGQVMGSITLPVLNMSPFPVAVASRSLSGSPVAESPPPGSPFHGRPIGQTAGMQGTDGSGRVILGSSSPPLVGFLDKPLSGSGFVDKNTAALVAEQDRMLHAHAVANHHDSRGSPSAHSGIVGVTSDVAGDVREGAFCSARQQGDADDTDMPTACSNLQVFYGAAESQGRRDYQQDRHTVIVDMKPSGSAAGAGVKCAEQVDLTAVFDGHKRCEAAELAHKRLPELLSREPGLFNADKRASKDEVCQALVSCFKQLDKEIIEDAQRSNIKDCQYGGTTALVALRFGQVLYVAHTGDSGAVMACTTYEMHFPLRLTADHKPNRPDEHARIQDAGGNIDEDHDRVVSDPKPHSNRVTLLNMSRSLGDPQFKQGGEGEQLVECMPEVRRIELQSGDTAIVLASDGLWDKVSDSDAISVIERVRAKRKVVEVDDATAKAAAQALVDEALRLGTRDNVTAVVMLFQWPEAPPGEA